MDKDGTISRPRKFYTFFSKKWFLSLLIVTSPSIFILCYWSYHFLFGHGENSYFNSSWILLTLCTAVSFFFALSKGIADRYNDRAKNRGQIILSKVLQSLNESLRDETDRNLQLVSKFGSEHAYIPLHLLINPKGQIRSLMTEVGEMLSEILGIPISHMSFSLIYRCDDGKWMHYLNVDRRRELSLHEIVSDPRTAARQVLDGKAHGILFLPDKRIGKNEGQYVPTERDRDFGEIGSVICLDTSVGTGKHHLQAVLTINTYGFQVCHVKDFESQHKIQKFMLDPVISRIKNYLSFVLLSEIEGKTKRHS
jgi:hypothetical protein